MSKKAKKSGDTNVLFDYGVNTLTRTILLYGSIDEDSTYLFECAMSLLEGISKDPITIRLNTSGGSVMDGNSIIDRILNSTCETHIHASGEVSSMGIFILAAGDIRTASPLTAFLHHEGTYSLEGKPSEHKNFSKFTEKQDTIMCQWLATRTNKDFKFWREKGTKLDHMFTSKEALQLGLIHEII